MILAFDAHYRKDHSVLAGVRFYHWAAPHPVETFHWEFPPAADYQPGQFYRRELPLVLTALQEFDRTSIATIVVDGYVYLDERSRLGLGGHLFESLGREVPVIGVAKSRFQNAPYQTIFRGKSIRPLYITAAGIPLKTAANRVLSMAGEYRMPDLLRHLDKLTKRDKS